MLLYSDGLQSNLNVDPIAPLCVGLVSRGVDTDSSTGRIGRDTPFLFRHPSANAKVSKVLQAERRSTHLTAVLAAASVGK